MMKTLTTLAILLALVSPCFASMIEYDQRDEAEQMQICLEHPVSPKLGVFAYSCLTENWKEAYAGAEVNGKVGKVNYQIALGFGRETGGNRTGGWLWASKGRFSAIYLLEDGASGTWDKFVGKYKVADRLSLGYTKKMYAGEGLYAEYDLGKGFSAKYSKFDTAEIGINVNFKIK